MSPDRDDELDGFVAAYESARGGGHGTDLAAFLPDSGHPLYHEVLRELVRVDLEFAWDGGEGRRLEYYRDRFPELFDDPVGLRAVAWEEFRLRAMAGEAPDVGEYRDRFRVELLDPVGASEDWESDRTPSSAPGSRTTAGRDPTSGRSGGLPPPDTGGGAGSRYELLGEIARGGMGTIYRATDLALDREVAIKVLRGGHAGSSAAARRFNEEARIAGRLQHPGVPAVHDLGTLPDGRPFLAMKLIQGRTLTAELAARPDPAHDRGRFVAAFEHVCQAVAYAHSTGVIHRDLKPSNVMVGEFGEVQVMDWGLAKQMRDAGCGTGNEDPNPSSASIPHPKAGPVLGTLAYMPPEQARGETGRVDERADVFALGGILCAILTGHPPYAAGDAGALAVVAARGELIDAFARLDLSRADPGLIALCKRCLAREPADRPRDAGEVAAAVTALRAEAEDRARRAEVERAAAEAKAGEERKRRRVQLALLASLLTLAGAAGAGGWWHQQQVLERQREAQDRQDEDARELAAVRQVVHAAVEQAYRDAAAGRWADARNGVARASDRLAGGAWPDELWDLVARGRADMDVGLALEQARLERAVSRPEQSRFDSERSAAAYRAAFTGYGIPLETLSSDEASARVRASRVGPALVAALDDWSSAVRDKVVKDRLRAVARAADADPWRGRLRDLLDRKDEDQLAALARDPTVPSQPPAALLLLAADLKEPARTDLLRAAQRAHPEDFWVNYECGRALVRQGRAKAVEAVGFLRAAVALRPDSPGARISLGVAQAEGGDLAAAAATYRDVIRASPRSALAHYNLGQALWAQGDLEGAEAAARETIRLDPKLPFAHYALGLVLWNRKDLSGAADAYREAARLDPQSPMYRVNLGAALRSLGDPVGAEDAYRAAIRLDPKSPLAHYNLGNVLRSKGDFGGALAAYREAIRLDPRWPNYHLNLGVVLREIGDRAGAEAAYRSALRAEPGSAAAHYNLGNILLDRGDGGGALAEYREAIRLDPKDPKVHVNLAEALSLTGDLAGAAEALREADRLSTGRPAVRDQLLRAERRSRAERLLPAIAAGRVAPATADDAVAAAEVCLLPTHRRYELAYDLYVVALAADPDRPAVPDRYNAARSAVQLAAGRDPAARIGEDERHRLHREARGWLRSAIAAARTKPSTDNPANRTLPVRWLSDPDLAPVREPAALAAMPTDERVEWERLWTEVRALLPQVDQPPPETAPPPR